MAIVALQLVSNAINLGLTGDVRELNGGDLSIMNTSAPLTEEQLRFFDQLHAQGVLTNDTAVESASGELHVAANGASRFFQVYAVNPAQFPLAGVPTFTTPANGSLPSLLQGDSAVITKAMAQTFQLKIGDTVRFSTRDGRSMDGAIAGVIENRGFFQGPMLLINQEFYAAQPSASNLPITYSAIYADVPGHTDANATTAEKLIQQTFPLASIQTTKQALAGNQAQVQQVQYFLQIVGLLALLIGGVGIVNTMQVLLRRRRIEIAMLKTAGYRRVDLYAMFGLEAGLIGLLGGVIGAAAGVGASFLVKATMEKNLQITLPTTIDPLTVASGVVVGFVAALIFGLLPIVQASQVRPQAVLRETTEGANWRGRLLTGLLLSALALLFCLLATAILGNARLAALVVGGAGVFFLVLGLLFGGVATLISKLPVVESFRWWYAPLLIVAFGAAAALTMAAPVFGVLCLIVTLMGAIVALLPRMWKVNMKLALRNIGRQKARTVTTLLALYIGVFSVGLILVLGQNITVAINSFLLSGNAMNAEVVASSADEAATRRELTQASGVQRLTERSFTQATPTMVNGRPIGDFMRDATSGGAYTPNEVVGVMNGAQGYDLAHGKLMDTVDTPVVSGRELSASDAGTANALLPKAALAAPSNLALGETVTLVSQADTTPLALTIVGFYDSKLPQAGPILTDASVVNTLSAGNPRYSFRMHLDPKTTDAALAMIQQAVPDVVAYNFADFADQYAALLNNLITVLVTVTSLAMLASTIIIANSVALAMLERRRELGILKAVGQTSRSLLGEVAIENGVVGFTGALLAIVMVVAIAILLGKVAFHLDVVIPTATVLQIVAVTVAICIAVAGLVAWRSTRMRPVEVLRYE
jgi:predicted lysophospholipase L1 biosynthesis ABC-type transport system permease subunit